MTLVKLLENSLRNRLYKIKFMLQLGGS